MNKTTLKALQGSIRKWEKIVAGKGADDGAENCPLCKKFSTENDCFDCNGCPVKNKTGLDSCLKSPYEKWVEMMRRHEVDHPVKVSDFPASSQAKAKRLAQAELDFLRSLLP